LPPIHKSVGTLASRLSYAAMTFLLRGYFVALLRLRFDFDQDVLVDGVAEVAQIVDLAGIAPDRLAGFVLGTNDLAVDRFDLDLAVGHRHDDVWQIVAMPAFARARIDRQLPDPHQVVLEQDAVPDIA